MLLGYAVENFKSFNDMQTLSMEAGKGRLKPEHLFKLKGKKILRFSAIYGANASGKSNFINSMKYAKAVILHGLQKGATRSYNRTNAENVNKPSTFCFEIYVSGRTYEYGFSVMLSQNTICAEWLYECHNTNKKLIFKRDLEHADFEIGKITTNSYGSNRLSIYFDDTKQMDTVLFLKEMNRAKDELYRLDKNLNVFKEVFRWFINSLSINYPDEPIASQPFFTSPERIPEALQFIKHFGPEITNFEVVDTDKEEYGANFPDDVLKDFQNHMEQRMIRAQKKGDNVKSVFGMLRGYKMLYILEMDNELKLHFKTIRFTHGKAGEYDISEESDGIRRILDLIEILFSENSNKTYVIDEIDRSLHPLLTREFISYYLKCLGDRAIQLIITTHESRLLDLDVLRRDEIWFSNKDDNGNSILYSLEEYNERFDKRIGDAYLNGRYNAIPRFGGGIFDSNM